MFYKVSMAGKTKFFLTIKSFPTSRARDKMLRFTRFTFKCFEFGGVYISDFDLEHFTGF